LVAIPAQKNIAANNVNMLGKSIEQGLITAPRQVICQNVQQHNYLENKSLVVFKKLTVTRKRKEVFYGLVDYSTDDKKN